MTRGVVRKPSLKKSLSAKYKGAYKRKIKKALIPGYGTRTAGWLHPKKKLYNKIYYRTSIDSRKLLSQKKKTSRSVSHYNAAQHESPYKTRLTKEFARLDLDTIPNTNNIKKHPKLTKWVYYLIQSHRACHYIWKAAIVLFFITALTEWEWAYFTCFYIWALAVALRYILPMIINTIDEIFFKE